MTDTARTPAPTGELAAEQALVDAAYARLDSMRRAARAVADGFGEAGSGGTHQARLEREAAEALTRRRLAALDIGESPLVFGRIDLAAGARSDDGSRVFRIGRIAVNDERQNPLVVDWRAPVAEPFYRATPLVPMDVVRRRHFQTRGRDVVGLDDEVFDRDAAERAGFHVVGEGALLAALERERSGRMRDIVATIQTEQDEAIRAPLEGLLVVAGGPGTGKTAVALHRAAYLLYTFRRKLGAGVLLVGPSPVFLRYIEEVLPSLGEDEVHLSTVTGLKPRLHATHDEPAELAALKGDARMADVIARAVRDRERALPRDVVLTMDRYQMRIRRRDSERIVERARRGRGTHNEKRRQVVRAFVELCRRRYVDAIARGFGTWDAGDANAPSHRPGIAAAIARGEEPPEEWEREVEQRIRRLPEFREVLERCWPILSGAELCHDLFGFEALVRSASDGLLAPSEQRALVRDRCGDAAEVEWSEADLALIDEADALLGPPEAARPRRRRRRESDAALEAASRVVEEMGLGGFMTAADLASRFAGGGAEIDVEPRRYAHVLVDEAQDLSAMQWRMLARRCPSGSFTVVGDFGQASRPGACASWDEVRAQLPERGGREVTLTVNYRTPAEIMDLAHGVLEATAPDIGPTRAMRHTGRYPEITSVPHDELIAYAAAAARRGATRTGTTACIAPPTLHDALVAELRDVGAVASAAEALDAPVAVLAPLEAKGLEFDHVVVVEPGRLVTGDPAGLRLLYVTLTRATRDLAVVHADPLPAALAASARRMRDRVAETGRSDHRVASG